MPDLHDPPSKHQPPPHLAALASFIEAAAALLEAWHPSLDGGRPGYLPPLDHLLSDLRTWQTQATSPPDATRGDIPHLLDLSDPAAFRSWLTALHVQLDDALSAGDDATRPPGQRDLGRRTARCLLFGARASIGALLASADRALPPPGGVAP